jgi:hypothetical protein
MHRWLSQNILNQRHCCTEAYLRLVAGPSESQVVSQDADRKAIVNAMVTGDASQCSLLKET